MVVKHAVPHHDHGSGEPVRLHSWALLWALPDVFIEGWVGETQLCFQCSICIPVFVHFTEGDMAPDVIGNLCYPVPCQWPSQHLLLVLRREFG